MCLGTIAREKKYHSSLLIFFKKAHIFVLRKNSGCYIGWPTRLRSPHIVALIFDLRPFLLLRIFSLSTPPRALKWDPQIQFNRYCIWDPLFIQSYTPSFQLTKLPKQQESWERITGYATKRMRSTGDGTGRRHKGSRDVVEWLMRRRGVALNRPR